MILSQTCYKLYLHGAHYEMGRSIAAIADMLSKTCCGCHRILRELERALTVKEVSSVLHHFNFYWSHLDIYR